MTDILKNNRQYIDQYGSWSFYPASAGFDSGLHGLSCEKGFRFFQTSYFVPVVISATVIGLMFSLFFNPTFGPINTFLKAVGMEKYIKNWLSDPDIVLFSVILPGIWQYLGYHLLFSWRECSLFQVR